MNELKNIKNLKITIELNNEGLVKQKIILDYGKKKPPCLKDKRYKNTGFINEFPEIRQYLESKADSLEACLFVRQQEDYYSWKK